MELYCNTIQTPVGELKLVAHDAALVAVLWVHEYERLFANQTLKVNDHHPILEQVKLQLEEYFKGQRTKFDLKLDMHGTEFQKKVWQALQSIPFGETRSYLQIATQIGNPKAVRAVGAANGRNPVSIIVPCHRVIGANGKLVGYAGGVDNKTKLLDLEQS